VGWEIDAGRLGALGGGVQRRQAGGLRGRV